jgi:hypothetical protein
VNAFGLALQRPNIVSLDLVLAPITSDETLLARLLAWRQACRAITFIGFVSVEKFCCRIGKHECHPSLGFASHLAHSARAMSRHQDLVLPDHTHV